MITIAWDIDDVLNDLMQNWFEKKWLFEHKDCSISYADLKENSPHTILGISKAEYLISLDEFRLSDQYLAMKPVVEVIQWFNEHGDNFRHLAITAVPLKGAHASASWLVRNFGRWIRNYHFIPSMRRNEQLPVYDNSKLDILKQYNHIDLFIDDNMNNLEKVNNADTKVMLFPRPWNNNTASIAQMLEKLTEYVYQLRENRQ